MKPVAASAHDAGPLTAATLGKGAQTVCEVCILAGKLPAA